MPPIERVTNGIQTPSVPLESSRLANCSTSLGILAPNGVVPVSGGDVPSIRRVTTVSVTRLPTAALNVPDKDCRVIGSMTSVCPINCFRGASYYIQFPLHSLIDFVNHVLKMLDKCDFEGRKGLFV